MYSAELEVQAKRKTLAILQEEKNKILNLSREITIITDAIIQGIKEGIRESSDKMRIIETEITMLEKKITRVVIATGSLMTYREDHLRTAYFIDEISGYISWVALRLSSFKPRVIKLNFEIELKGMVDKCQQASNSFTILALSI